MQRTHVAPFPDSRSNTFHDVDVSASHVFCGLLVMSKVVARCRRHMTPAWRHKDRPITSASSHMIPKKEVCAFQLIIHFPPQQYPGRCHHVCALVNRAGDG